MKLLNELFAEVLLDIKAVKLQPDNPFTWANGWQCPIYFDSRKLLSYPRTRRLLRVEMSRVMLERYPDAEVIAAVAPNAIALGMLVADELGLNFVYVNPTPKDHGLENSIEGDLKPRQKVVIIDDQISVGFRCTRVKTVLEEDGSEVIGMIAMFNYDLAEGAESLRKAGLVYYTLTNFHDIVKKLQERRAVSAAVLAKIEKWQNDPAKWKK